MDNSVKIYVKNVFLSVFRNFKNLSKYFKHSTTFYFQFVKILHIYYPIKCGKKQEILQKNKRFYFFGIKLENKQYELIKRRRENNFKINYFHSYRCFLLEQERNGTFDEKKKIAKTRFYEKCSTPNDITSIY